MVLFQQVRIFKVGIEGSSAGDPMFEPHLIPKRLRFLIRDKKYDPKFGAKSPWGSQGRHAEVQYFVFFESNIRGALEPTY